KMIVKIKAKIVSCFLVLMLMQNVSAKAGSIINIVDMGADNTGKALCTEVIKLAIDSLLTQGGGEVYLPSGEYLCGPIEMKSNITLNIEAGAILKFSDDFAHYLPMIKSRWEGIRVNNFKSAIYAHNATNITIKGRGLIDGNGKKWWDFWWDIKGKGFSLDSEWEKIFYENNKELVDKTPYLKKIGNFLRPPLFMPYECTNIRVEGVTFKNPAFWTLMPTFSENITIDGITIINPED
ncbi:MAG: glycosyl hydrolase family 28-related protein, partial [Bacteroidales bacterium]|nr:glycosyl hydrolase family 28-related protein [Bacteroidales bacterium]